MAMKEVWTHPKFKALKMRLGLADWQAIGLLEAVWGICIQVKSCRAGLIAWEPQRIAAYIGWAGDAVDMIAALVECGWLDRDGEWVRVHDWERHAPRWIKGVLEKQRKQPTPPNSVANSVSDSVADSVGHSAGMGGGKGVLGLGVQGEGVTPEWLASVRRWPDHATLTERGVEAQRVVCARMLTAQGLPEALAARLWPFLMSGWAKTGCEPRKAVEGLLGGLDAKSVRSKRKLLEHRVSEILESSQELAA